MSIALIAAMAVTYEVLLIRIFAIVHWHHLVAIAISLALLGYGASGTFLTVTGGWLRRRSSAAYVVNGLLFSISSLLCVNLAQQIDVDPQALHWNPAEALGLAGSFVLLALPFFTAANCIGLMLSRFEREIPRIYGVDLLGAGAGAIGILLLLHLLAPATLLGGIMLGGLLATVLGAVTLGWRPLVSTGGALLIAVAMLIWQPAVINSSAYKDLPRALAVHGASLETVVNGVTGTLSVVRNSAVPIRTAPGFIMNASALPPAQLAVLLDGDAVDALPSQEQQTGSNTYLTELISALPYQLPQPPRQVAILYAGMGTKVRQALELGAQYVVAVEPNRQLYQMACGDYRAIQKTLCVNRQVEWQVQGPRTYLAGTSTRFDLIDLTVAAEPDGLDALSSNYGVTREAMSLYLRRLSTDGLIAIEGPARAPPRLSMRMLATAQDALRQHGVAAPGAHLVMLRGWQRFQLLISNSPFSSEARSAVRDFSRRLGFDLVWLPGMQPAEANRYQQLAEPLFHRTARALLLGATGRPEAVSRFRDDPVTDNRPYPHRSTRWTDAAVALASGAADQRSQLDTGLTLGIATLLTVSLAAVLLILLPLFALSGNVSEPTMDTPRRPSRFRTLLYFALIGAAFMIIEIAWIERLQHFLGHPVYATTAVLAVFLMFAGLGSLWVQATARALAQRHLLFAVLTIAGSALVFRYALTPVSELFAGQTIAVRIAVTVLLLAPLAFAMGVPFPTALRALARRAPPLVPWAWGINGCASVIAAAAMPLLGGEFGFHALVTLAGLSYLALPLMGLSKD